MKKFIVFAFTLVVLILMNAMLPIAAADLNDSDNYRIVLKADFDIPQLTKEELSADTESLVLDIIKSPYVQSLLYEPNCYQTLLGGFNGLRELESRKDASSTLFALLSSQTRSNSLQLTDLALIELLIFQNVYRNTLTFEELNILELYTENSTSNYHFATENQLYSNPAQTIEDIEYFIGNTVYTASGKEIETMDANRNFTSAEKLFKSNEMQMRLEAYSLSMVNEIADPSTRYNCHSYAWNITSTVNEDWINSNQVNKYLSDPHCQFVNANNLRSGDILVYLTNGGNSYGHSAVVTEIRPNGTIMCVSKWGDYGLYEHSATQVLPEYCYMGSQIEIIPVRYTTNHTLRVYSQNNSYSHILKCDVCNVLIEEAHEPDALDTYCIVCKKEGPFTNFNPLKLDEERDAK